MDNLMSHPTEYAKVAEAVSEGRATPIDEFSHKKSSSIVEDFFLKANRQVARSAKKECYYLGFLAALSILGNDETMNEDDRITLARKMSVEARKFLVERDIIESPSWLTENKKIRD